MVSRFADDQLPIFPDRGEHLQPVRGVRRPAIASIVIASVVGLAVIAGVIMLVLLRHALPDWILILLISLDVIGGAGVISMLLLSRPRAHTVRFTIATVLAVLLTAANGVGVKAGVDGFNFGNGITAPVTEGVLFDVVVLDNGPTDISQLKGSLMGEYGADDYQAAVHVKIASMIDVQFVPSTPWSAAVTALVNQDVTSIVIQDVFMQVLADADPPTYAKLRILTSFELDASQAVAPSGGASGGQPSTPMSTLPPPPGKAFVVYISGIDTYGPVSTRSRSDVNILMVVNPDTSKILLVNTPRDFYVQLRGTTGLKDKLTHAGVYGIDVSMGTLEDLYGISIQYYLRINFSSLVNIVDTMGGIDVESAYAFSAQGYNFVVGTNHLSGAAALAFARDRYDFAGGDRVRGENQQRVIEGIIKKMSDPSVLVRYNSILNAVQGSLQTSMPMDVILGMVRQQLTSGQSWQVSSISVNGGDGSEYTYSYPGQKLYVMIPDQATVDAATEQIKATENG